MAQKRIACLCGACDGTGVYSGMCERKGEAVVCLHCDGTGNDIICYVPFTGRKRRRGIKTVRRSRGTFIATGVGGTGKEVTYKEFLEGKLP